MTRLPPLPETRKGRILLGAVLFFVFSSAAVGIGFWMRHIAYLKSPVCAVDRLNEAILTGNAELFDAVFPQDASRDFALRLADTIPPEFLSQRDPQILAQYMRELLTALLRGDPAPDFVQNSILPILPEDFFRQLTERPFSLVNANAHLAVAESTFRHPSCKEELRLILGFGRSDNRWKAVGILNARELLSIYLTALDKEKQRLARLHEDTQAFHLRKIAHYLPGAVCKAGPMRLSGGHAVLIISLTGAPNPGPEIVESWGLEFPITDEAGTVLACPRLSESGKLMPGNELRRSWTLDLEEDAFRRLKAAGELRCRVVPLYVLLDNGTMYSSDPRWLKRAGHTVTPSEHP